MKRDGNLNPGVLVSDYVEMSDGAKVPNTPEAIEQYHASHKVAFAAVRAANAERNSLITARRCPFQYEAESGMARPCKRDCVFFVNDVCMFSAHESTVETLGKSCPFMKRCNADCAMYSHGCTL